MSASNGSKPALELTCPLPLVDFPKVQLAHGGGGRMTHTLIDKVFLKAFDNPTLRELHDSARIDIGGQRVAFTTDSFVIRPLFFPGGDIGSLAVNGTVNDLAMAGARPLALSAGFILEEGFATADLARIVASMRTAADAVGVSIVTGDTKVVDRGKGDGVYINTAGIGLIPAAVDLRPARLEPGDVVIVSGDIAVHGIAIMSVREGLSFETTLESDCAGLWPLVAALLDACGPSVRIMRDPTRGGVATTLNEIAAGSPCGIVLDEAAIPVREDVRGACELLGLDPLYVANEGKFLAVVAASAAEQALAALRAHPLGSAATIIGRVVDDHVGRLTLRSGVGGLRVLDLLSGEQLPRIC